MPTVPRPEALRRWYRRLARLPPSPHRPPSERLRKDLQAESRHSTEDTKQSRPIEHARRAGDGHALRERDAAILHDALPPAEELRVEVDLHRTHRRARSAQRRRERQRRVAIEIE